MCAKTVDNLCLEYFPNMTCKKETVIIVAKVLQFKQSSFSL